MFLELIDNLRDELTQVYNRRYLDFIFSQELKKIRRYGGQFSVLYIDLDDFNLINNLYGHREGDRLLYEFAQFLAKSLRETDSVIRLSGDEFIVILTHTPASNAKAVCERIINELKKKDFKNSKLSCSIGVVEVPTNGTDWHTIFSRLEVALFKAKKSGKGTYYILQEKDAVSPIIPAPVISGRKKELAWLIERINNSEVSLIAVSGAPGVGKSTLIKEALKNLRDTLVVIAKSSIDESSGPFSPFRTILKKIKEFDYFAFKEAFEALDETERVALGLLYPELGYIPENVDRYKFYDAYVKLISILSDRQKIVAFIDDIHLGDSTTLELLYYLLHADLKKIKFVIAFRKEDHENKGFEKFYSHVTRERLIEELQLKELSQAEAFDLIETILQRKCSENLKERLYEKCGGNPYFLEETIKEFFKHEIIYFDGENWNIKADFKDHVPESLQNILTKRLTRFQSEKLLEIMACLGNEFNLKILELVTQTNLGEIFDTIDKLIRSGIIVERNVDTFAFKEGMTREMILSQLNEPRKRFIHRSILSVLEKHAEVLKIPEEKLAYHAYYAGEKEKVKKYSLNAARKCKKFYAYEEAKKYYKWYLGNEDDLQKAKEAAIEYADLLLLTGDISEAIDELNSYLSRFGEDAAILDKLAEAYSKSGKFYEAIESIEKAIKIEPKNIYILRKAWLLLYAEKIREALNILEEFKKREKELTEQEKAYYYNTFALLLMEEEEYEEAEKYFKRALELREKLGNERGVANIHLNLGTLYANQGLHVKALEEYEKAKETYDAIGDKRGMLTAIHNYSDTLRYLRRYEEAIKGLENAIKIARQIRDDISLLLGLCNLASIYIEIGEFEKVEKLLTEAEQMSKSLQIEALDIYVKKILMSFYSKGNRDEGTALRIFEEIKELLPKIDSRATLIDAVLETAESLLLLGKIDLAKPLIEKFENILEESKTSDFRLKYYVIKAILSHKFHDKQAYIESLKKLGLLRKDLREDEKTRYIEYSAILLGAIGKKEGMKKMLSRLMENAQNEILNLEIVRLTLLKENLERTF